MNSTSLSDMLGVLARADKRWAQRHDLMPTEPEHLQYLAAAIDRSALAPLRARIEQLESWCSCQKPGWPS